jgi:acyl-CoA synthetase (AMP-forming)/AMP-acid ligase II
MNIYVRSLSSALARAGVACDVYTRAEHPGQPRVVTVEPNFRVFNIPAGPAAPVPKESLPGLVDEFTESMLGQIRACGRDYELLHANYWLSGQAAHRLKHELSLPMVATFHTLALVKQSGARGTGGVPATTAAGAANGSDWLRTGDLGRLDEEGYLYFVDRAKDIIKRAGENVSASEVERVLSEFPGVAEAAVVGRPDPIRDEAVVAFVVPATGAAIDTAALDGHCRARLARFKVPEEYVVVDALPKTSIGKIEKKALRERLAPQTRQTE